MVSESSFAGKVVESVSGCGSEYTISFTDGTQLNLHVEDFDGYYYEEHPGKKIAAYLKTVDGHVVPVY